jgi:aspartyl-tRNA(Asn)/glutamyl-tRNA(Gln) amidotransferase subunit B
VRAKGLTQVADRRAGGPGRSGHRGNPRRWPTSRPARRAAAKALVGQVMKASGGKANPGMVDRLVQEKLSTM